jgi:Fucose permease
MIKRQKSLIIVSYLTIFFLGFYLAMFQSLILNFALYHDVNSAVMGTAVSANYIGVSLAPLLVGMLASKASKKSITTFSYIMLIIGTLSVFLSSNIWLQIISFSIIGGGYGITEATLSAILVDEYPDKANLHMNLSQVLFSIGALSGPYITKGIVGIISYQFMYLGLSLIFAVLITLFRFTKISAGKQTDDWSDKGSIFKIIRSKTFILLLCAMFFYVGIEELVGFFTDSYLYSVVNAPQYSALALSLFWGLMIPSRFLAGVLKNPVKAKIVFCSVLLAISVLMFVLVDNIVLKLLMVAFIGFGSGPLWPLLMTVAGEKFKDHTGPVFNLLMSLGGFGGVALPFIAGHIIVFSNETVAFYLAAFCVLVLLSCYLLASRNKPV